MVMLYEINIMPQCLIDMSVYLSCPCITTVFQISSH